MSAEYKLDLIDDLASGKETKSELARKYGFGATYIGRFADRYAIQIAARKDVLGIERSDKDSSSTGLAEWIADPDERIAAFERIFEAHMPTVRDPKSARICIDVLKAVAELLGQLPQRVQQSPAQHEVVYRIEGVNPSDAV